MTHTDERETRQAMSATSTTTHPFTGALRDNVLSDITRLHLVSLLDTDEWCRFAYLRDALGLSDDRLKRHFYLLRSCGYADTTRDKTGAGWACLTPLGATRRDAQFATLREVLSAVRHHLAAAQQSRPDWFTPVSWP